MKNTSVKLRPISLLDSNSIVKWRNSEHVRKNFIYQKDFTVEGQNNWYKEQILTNKVSQFIIFSEEFGKDLGTVYLRDIDWTHKKAEFGIFIGEEDCRGVGVGTIATKLMVKYGFFELGLNRIFLRVFTRNFGAIKAYKKVGFKEEGIFRQDVFIGDKFEDVMYMSILKTEFEELLAEDKYED